MITVYTKSDCTQCRMTKNLLQRCGLDYKEVDFEEDEDAREFLKTLGFKAAPVVVIKDDSWSGFRPDKIKQLAKEK